MSISAPLPPPPTPPHQAGPGAAAITHLSQSIPLSPPRAYTIMVAGAAKGKTALLRLLIDTAVLAPNSSPSTSCPVHVPFLSRPSVPTHTHTHTHTHQRHPYPAPTPENIARFVHGSKPGRTTRVRTCSVEVLRPPSEVRPSRSPSHSHSRSSRSSRHPAGGHVRVPEPDQNNEASSASETVLLNLVDTPSLDTTDALSLERSLPEVLNFIEARFAESIDHEQKARTGDHHVHLCLYLLDPDTIVPLPASPLPSPLLVPTTTPPDPDPETLISASGSVPAGGHHHRNPPQSNNENNAPTPTHTHSRTASNTQLSHLTLPPPPSVSVSGSHREQERSHSGTGSGTFSRRTGNDNGNPSGNGNDGNENDTPVSSSAGARGEPSHVPRPSSPVDSPTTGSCSHFHANGNGNGNVDVEMETETGTGSCGGERGVLSPSDRDKDSKQVEVDGNVKANQASVSTTTTTTTTEGNQERPTNADDADDTEFTLTTGVGGVVAASASSHAHPDPDHTPVPPSTRRDSPLTKSHPRRLIPPPPPPPPNNPSHLPPLEVAAIKALSARTNVLPVLARSDTVTAARLAAIKRAVRADLAAAGIGFGIFDAGPGCGEDLYPGDDNDKDDKDEDGEGEGDGEVKMEVDAPAPSKSKTKKSRYPPVRIPRLPHAILTPDIYAHDEGIQLDLFDLGDMDEDEDVEAMLGAESFEELVRRYTVTSPSPPSSDIETLNENESDAKALQRPENDKVDNNDAGIGRDEERETSMRDVQNATEKPEESEKKGSEKVKSPSSTVSTSNAPSSSALPTLKKSSGGGGGDGGKSACKKSATKSVSSGGLVKKGRFVRRYRWGVVDALDPTHCDFIPLRQAVFHHMQPLRTYTREYLFEKFRVEIHHRRQHLATHTSSLHPPSAYPHSHHGIAASALSPTYASATATYAPGSPTKVTSTSGYPFPPVVAYNGTTVPYPTTMTMTMTTTTPASASGSGVSPRSAALLSPGIVDPVKEREHSRSAGEREREALWERERSRDRERDRERERERARERDRERRAPFFPTPLQPYPARRSGALSDIVSPELVPVAPLGVPTPTRISSGASLRDRDRERHVRERERELERERERDRRGAAVGALPPLAHVAASHHHLHQQQQQQQGIAMATLPPLSAVSSGAPAVASPTNGRGEYVREREREREREYYARERVYDRERERERQRELDRERDYRARRASTIGIRDGYEVERAYDYAGYERASAIPAPPPAIASSRSYRERSTREEYADAYISDEEREREEAEKYRRERYEVPPPPMERGRERIGSAMVAGGIRRPVSAVSPHPHEREYERERDREFVIPRPVSSGGVAVAGRDVLGQRHPGVNVNTTASTSTSGPPSASLNVPLSAHPSAHASPSSAYTHGHGIAIAHHGRERERDIIAGVGGAYEKSVHGHGHGHAHGHVPGSTSGTSSVAGSRSSMHHMQHRHHGGGHVLGPVNPDNEFDRDILRDREREREREVERIARERELEKQRERERERERLGNRERVTGYGLRSSTEARQQQQMQQMQMGGAAGAGTGTGTGSVDYPGRPVVIEEDVHARLRTKKITVACNFCRSRKLKCDGGRPSCSQCIKRQHSCDYKAHARRRGGVARAAQVQGQQHQQERSHSEGEEDALGELDAEYEGVSGAEDVQSTSAHLAVAGTNGTSAGGRHMVPVPPVDRRPGSGGGSTVTGPLTSRRSSNVDMMIAETLQSPRSVAREQERERERDYAYATATATAAGAHGIPSHHPHGHPNGHAYGSQLAPLPFSGVNSTPSGSSAASASASVTSPGGQRALTTNVQLLPSAQNPTGVIALGGMTPAEQAVAASATGRKRGGPKLSRIASNYGPKVVACNFCRARKTKCDGQHPTCQSCARRSLPCSYVNEGAPGRGRKPGQTYKHLKDQKGKGGGGGGDPQTDLAKFAKDQPQYLTPASGSTAPPAVAVAGAASVVVAAAAAAPSEGDRDGGGGGGAEEEGSGGGETTPVPTSSAKRNFVDEDNSDVGKKRLRVDNDNDNDNDNVVDVDGGGGDDGDGDGDNEEEEEEDEDEDEEEEEEEEEVARRVDVSANVVTNKRPIRVE